MSLKENTNKENIPLSPQKSVSERANQQQLVVSQLQKDVKTLEKLYKEEVLRSQSTLQEQEKLELDLLKKEKQILSQQQSLQKLSELNKSLSKKLSGEVSFYEGVINNYKKQEKDWDERFKKLKNGHLKFENLLQKKKDELYEVHQELEYTKNELDGQKVECFKMQNTLNNTFKKLDDLEASIPEPRGEPLHTFKNLDDDSNEESSDGELDSLVLKDDDDEDEFNDNEEETSNEQYDITDNSLSLANEINDQIHENRKLIKSYQFEVKSLKNEKVQLYNYINKLLKNKPNVDQNSILKEKLVKRKILRAISINQANTQQIKSSRPKSGKRIISTNINFKSYGHINKRLNEVPQNSDDEDEDEVDEDEIRLIGNQNIGHNYFLKSKYLMNPLEFLIVKNHGDENEVNSMNLDID